MATYPFRCTYCRTETTVSAPIAAGAPKSLECGTCGGPAKRVFTAAPVRFRGTGFYTNDSRDPDA